MSVVRNRVAPACLRAWGAGPARLRPTRLVLCYHSVSDGNAEPHGFLSRSRCLEMSEFAQQMEWLCQIADVVHLADLLDGPSTGLRVAITVDDGYANNVRLLFPFLQRLGIPATWFVATSFVDDPSKLPWWDLLDWVIETQQPQLDLHVVGIPIRVELNNRKDCQVLRSQVGPILAKADPLRCEEILATILNQVQPPTPPANAFARPEDLRTVARTLNVSIGSHTTHHANLKYCSSEEIVNEVENGRKQVSSMCGNDTPWFAYPYGHHDAVDVRVADALRPLALRGCCTLIPGVVGNHSDRMLIPRINVPPNISISRFKALVTASRLYAAASRIAKR